MNKWIEEVEDPENPQYLAFEIYSLGIFQSQNWKKSEVLSTVIYFPGLTQTQLVDKTGIAQSQISQILKALKENHLVDYQIIKSDGKGAPPREYYPHDDVLTLIDQHAKIRIKRLEGHLNKFARKSKELRNKGLIKC